MTTGPAVALVSLRETALRDIVFESVADVRVTSYLRTSLCDREAAGGFLGHLLQGIRKSPETAQVRWSIRNALCALGVFSQDDMSREIAVADFKARAPEIAKQILPCIQTRRTIDDKLARNLGFELVLLGEQFPGIRSAMDANIPAEPHVAHPVHGDRRLFCGAH